MVIQINIRISIKLKPINFEGRREGLTKQVFEESMKKESNIYWVIKFNTIIRERERERGNQIPMLLTRGQFMKKGGISFTLFKS